MISCKECKQPCIYSGGECEPSHMCRMRIQTFSNADRIRGMTDEELAHFIAGQRGWYCNFKDPEEEEYPKVLDWLKAPVDGGEA